MVPPSAEALPKLLTTLYAAPTQPELWNRFLEELTQFLGLPAAAILHQDLGREHYGFSAAVGVDPEAQLLYEKHYGSMDVWRPKFLAKREGELVLGESLYPTEQLVKTEYYNGFVRRFGLKLYAAVVTVKQPTSFEHVSVYCAVDAGPPPPSTLAALELIVPHVRTALQWRHRLCEAEVLSRNHLDAIESLRAGVVMLNQHGDCLFVNNRARRLCAANDGIDIRRSRLCAHHPEDHQGLCGLIERATAVTVDRNAKAWGIVSVRRRFASSLQLSAVPLSQRAPLSQLTAAKIATAALFIRSLDDEATSLPELLIAGYRLTSAESRLAAHLFAGASLSQAAERNDVSRETVRAQLRSIFGKTHVRRQTDLLRLCWQLVRTL